MGRGLRILLSVLLLSSLAQGQGSIFEFSLRAAADALKEGRVDDAAIHIQRALERDPKSAEAWGLRAAWGEAVGDRDELVYALHKEYGLRLNRAVHAARGEKVDKKALAAQKARLIELDPQAGELFSLRDKFVDQLQSIADQYEKEKRPHSAIRVLQQILAIDPEVEAAQQAIERISAAPDPSLAETARPKDLMEGISEQWVRTFDADHGEWKTRAKLERDNYVTYTDAGYEVLLRAAEAMDQMNAFYRQFFQYGTEDDGRSVARIDLNIFKNRDEYLTLGIGPPVEWSGGHFTGGAVETYIAESGFEGMVGTLFHEAAHQFVSLATTAAGWLNEGLASFFEGCRILNNGTVIMNMPANHRLFPLVTRLEQGWMKSFDDGLSATDANATPTTAPTLQIILENKYSWGPPWYAPTWGFVYFLYNYQDPADGRFIYRQAFRDFVNSSGGRQGEGAIENFEEVVLKHPQPPTDGLPRTEALKLVRTVDALNDVWKDWLIALADEQSGRSSEPKPYLDWALYAIERREFDVATEHFEKGLVQAPLDVDLLVEFARHLAERKKNKDRATRLIVTALQVLESQSRVDEKRVRQLDSLLSQWDPSHAALDRIHAQLRERADAIVNGYVDGNLPLMAMEISWRLGTDLNLPGMFSRFEQAARSSGKSIALWQLAYNEENLDGWTAAGSNVWMPYGSELLGTFGTYAKDDFLFNFLTCDKITSGDFSMEAEVYAEREKVNFCGLVFGRKGDLTFHAVILHPGWSADAASGRQERGGYLDVTSFYGGGAANVWRHNPVDTSQRGWHKLRLDVSGSLADVWWDGELLVTQDFGSVDVLRGSFGLITGRGASRYRNIRYLARSPRDPGARIEREIRMGKLEKAAGTGAIGGSWLRKEPPFPTVDAWIQGRRFRFDEGEIAPQLLVFWSIQQNDQLPIHEWLAEVVARNQDIGLSALSVVSYMDRAGIDAYLAAHPFPGVVAVDRKGPPGGFGETFDRYFIGKRFNLPRVLLLDIDGRVVWEGDPGIEFGHAWKKGDESYLDQPLKDLLARRRLPEAKRWMKGWIETGGPALSIGDFDGALALLKQATNLPHQAVPIAADAQSWMRALTNAADNLEVAADQLVAAQAEAALPLLLDWAVKIEHAPSAKTRSALKVALAANNAKNWKTTLADAARVKAKLKPGKEWDELNGLLTSLGGRSDPFAVELADGLRHAIDKRDLSAARAVLEDAPRIPARWLVYWLASSA